LTCGGTTQKKSDYYKRGSRNRPQGEPISPERWLRQNIEQMLCRGGAHLREVTTEKSLPGCAPTGDWRDALSSRREKDAAR
jgi:hypothetical protein